MITTWCEEVFEYDRYGKPLPHLLSISEWLDRMDGDPRERLVEVHLVTIHPGVVLGIAKLTLDTHSQE